MGPAVTVAGEAAPARPAAVTPSGARSGALLGIASAVSIGANYVFLTVSGRLLHTGGYGSLTALLALLAVVLLPAGALQLAVSRDVSRLVAVGERATADAFARRASRAAALATAPLVLVALALAYPLGAVLHIDSIGIVVLAESTLLTALVGPVAMGVLQGFQRFHAIAALYVVPFVIRLGLLAVVVHEGYRLRAVLLVY